MDERDPAPPPVEIPFDSLSPEALDGIIDSFILREGTDYGLQEASYGSRVDKLKRQIDAGTVKIVYDPSSESVTLMTEAEWKKKR